MSKEGNNIFETWFAILLSVVAFVAIRAIFENDNSKIVSKKGRKILSNDTKMDSINEEIQKSELNNQHQEIYV